MGQAKLRGSREQRIILAEQASRDQDAEIERQRQDEQLRQAAATPAEKARRQRSKTLLTSLMGMAVGALSTRHVESK